MWPAEASENTGAAHGTLSVITAGGSKLCSGPKFADADSKIVADQNFSGILNLDTSPAAMTPTILKNTV